jgi:hypothetical protein
LKQRQGLLRDPVYNKSAPIAKPVTNNSVKTSSATKQSTSSTTPPVVQRLDKKPVVQQRAMGNGNSSKDLPTKKLSAWDQIMSTMKGNEKPAKKGNESSIFLRAALDHK